MAIPLPAFPGFPLQAPSQYIFKILFDVEILLSSFLYTNSFNDELITCANDNL